MKKLHSYVTLVDFCFGSIFDRGSELRRAAYFRFAPPLADSRRATKSYVIR